ncbi:transcription factor 25 isoform X2 [Ctenocephalides felis]|uniref:transcription factor 25 isoform X2 n=1 Tax=Ctenocephalides felis TaxID=7515 RepID=UPI000E6E4A35|nr:transcription factor 25 isoform X2 [Ctenocephalides felis]
MSSRVLRKLQGDKDLPEDIVSDPDLDVPYSSGGARRKQLNINRYDLLSQESHSESEVKEDDNETEHASAAGSRIQNNEQVKRKKKKRKKKSGKNLCHRSSEDNCEIVGEFDNEFGAVESKESVDSTHVTEFNPVKTLLIVQHRHLNPNTEMKRMFGSRVIQADQSKRRGRGSRPVLKSTWIVSSKDSWPPAMGKSGLGMDLVKNSGGIHTFCFTHGPSYQQTQKKFLEAVESLNPENIVNIINQQPYHVDALLQLSDLCKMSEDLAVASELIERALYGLEMAFHPLFNLAQGTCRLDYKRQENRALFIALFKHAQFLEGRACPRTALEISKLILALDPDSDPLAMILIMDYYAIRAREYSWLVELFDQWDYEKNFTLLPNMSYSVAQALFYLNRDGDLSRANEMLQMALLMFPGVLKPLLDKIGVKVDSRVENHNFFGSQSQTSQSPSLNQLCKLFVSRNHCMWKDPILLPWLESNVQEVLNIVDNALPVVEECAEKRAHRYPSPTPRNILRHVVLSDFKDVPTNIAEGINPGPMLSFDPLPPLDSINLYSRPTHPSAETVSTMSYFFQSLLPNFNVPNFNPNQPNNNLANRQLDIAINNEEAAGGDNAALRQSLAALLDSMRDLLLNLRFPEARNDADGDVDEDDDDDDDDDAENLDDDNADVAL